jgi:cyclic pyranopterin phosphate synthase
MLGFREIEGIVRTVAPLGITKIRLTGGEPLVRPRVEELVELLASIEGIREIAMTTNGQLLSRLAGPLAESGLDRVNISLDTLDPERYRKITGGGQIRRVIQGIDASIEAGLTPVKINCVLTPDTTEEEITNLREFCRVRNLELRFIRQMDLHAGKFWKVEGGQGGHCGTCNRMRLTVDGHFIPCLFSEIEYSIRDFGIRGAFMQAIQYKPQKGHANTRNTFHSIGG